MCDIVGFGSRDLHDHHQRHLRDILYQRLRQAFGGSGVPFDSCYWEDRGDGAIVVLPADVRLGTLVSALPDKLRAELRQYNELASELVRIRLRVAVHIGEIGSDDHGIVGKAVNHVARLVDAPALKDMMLAASAGFGLIVSAEVHDLAVLPGDVVDPDEFEAVDVRLKETDTMAWVRISERRPPAGDLRPAGEPIVNAGTRPADTDGRPMAGSLIPGDGIFDITERLLGIPMMIEQSGREQFVRTLPERISSRIARHPQARLDICSIVTACLDFPGGLQELLGAVRFFAGDSYQTRALEETIAELVTRDQSG